MPIKTPEAFAVTMKENTIIKDNEERNLSGSSEISPLPAQVEGLATARPWRHQTEDGTLGSIVDANGDSIGQTFARIGDSYHVERQANAELIVTAINEYAGNKAKIEALTAGLKQSRTLISTLKHIDSLDRASLDAAVDLTMRKIDAALIESPTETKPESEDICDRCGEDFGLSGKDANGGYNSKCVHCGNSSYSSIESPEDAK